MLPIEDFKEKTVKKKSEAKLKSLSTALKKNLQRRKKVKKEKDRPC